jgi:hypothetical protein
VRPETRCRFLPQLSNLVEPSVKLKIRLCIQCSKLKRGTFQLDIDALPLKRSPPDKSSSRRLSQNSRAQTRLAARHSPKARRSSSSPSHEVRVGWSAKGQRLGLSGILALGEHRIVEIKASFRFYSTFWIQKVYFLLQIPIQLLFAYPPPTQILSVPLQISAVGIFTSIERTCRISSQLS